MAPTRARALDDSRSETSSTIFNLKDKALPGAASGASISKQKKNGGISANNISKPVANGPAAAGDVSTAPDPNPLKVDWTTLSPALLHNYRIAYRIPTQASYTHPHADLIYKSSKTALRAPSAVLARRRLRDLKHQRRKAAVAPTTSGAGRVKNKEKEKDKDKETDSSSNSDRLLKPRSATNQNSAGDNATALSPADDASSSDQPSAPPIAPDYIGKQTPTSLAMAVRKHFNAQQLNEAEVVARFTYVAKQSRNNCSSIRVEGSGGDTHGWWIGSQGREIRKEDGGEVGFRIRFRP